MGIEATFGFAELKKALDLFPKNVQKNILTGATRAAASYIRDEVKENAPYRTGNLKKSIGTNKRRSPSQSMVWYSVSPRQGGKNDGFYGKFLEFGTSKMSPKPFMRPTFEAKGEKGIDAFFDYAQKRIDKEAAKAANGRS